MVLVMLSGVKDNDIDKLINEIKSIVDVILKEGNADAGNDKRPKMVHPPQEVLLLMTRQENYLSLPR
nr:variable large family protein [Borrelia nietonii]